MKEFKEELKEWFALACHVGFVVFWVGILASILYNRWFVWISGSRFDQSTYAVGVWFALSAWMLWELRRSVDEEEEGLHE